MAVSENPRRGSHPGLPVLRGDVSVADVPLETSSCCCGTELKHSIWHNDPSSQLTSDVIPHWNIKGSGLSEMTVLSRLHVRLTPMHADVHLADIVYSLYVYDTLPRHQVQARYNRIEATLNVNRAVFLHVNEVKMILDR